MDKLKSGIENVKKFFHIGFSTCNTPMSTAIGASGKIHVHDCFKFELLSLFITSYGFLTNDFTQFSLIESHNKHQIVHSMLNSQKSLSPNDGCHRMINILTWVHHHELIHQ